MFFENYHAGDTKDAGIAQFDEKTIPYSNSHSKSIRCRGPPSLMFHNHQSANGGITVDHTPKKVFILKNDEYIEITFQELYEMRKKV